MNKNERFLASPLNAKLKRRVDNSSIIGLINEIHKAQINKMPCIQDWIKITNIDLTEIDAISGNTYQKIGLGLH